MKFFRITCSGGQHVDYENFCEELVLQDTYIEYLTHDFASISILGAVTHKNALTPDDLELMLSEAITENLQKNLLKTDPRYFGSNVRFDIEEVSYANLVTSSRNRANMLLQKANLTEFLELHERGIYQRNLLSSTLNGCNHDWKKLYAEASSSYYSGDLTAELDRILGSPANHSVVVNYVITVADTTSAYDAKDVLLKVLEGAGRAPSRYIYTFDFFQLGVEHTPSRSFQEVKDLVNMNLGVALRNSTLILDYSRLTYGSKRESVAYEVLTQLLDRISHLAREIQIVFLVPSNSKNLIENLIKRTPLPVVLIEPDKVADLSSMSPQETRRQLAEKLSSMSYSPQGSSLDRLLEKTVSNYSFHGTIDDLANQWINEHNLETDYYRYANAVRLPDDILSREAKGIDRLKELIGLKAVKEEIIRIVRSNRSEFRYRRLGLPPSDASLHCVFQGPPGTGKTEVARIYAEILRDAGIIPEGRILEVDGSALGSPGYFVNDVFRRGKGSIIFIDEAYAISPPLISELIAQMENNRSDTVVILAGYRESMQQLLSFNEGFRSRIGAVIDFPNYSTDELVQIFDLMAKHQNLKLTDAARSLVQNQLAAAGMRPDQGNARYVRQLLADIRQRQQERIDVWISSFSAGDSAVLEPELTLEQAQTIIADDVPTPEQEAIPAVEQLEQLVGLHSIKDEVKRQLDFVEIQKIRRDRGIATRFTPMHMVFTGNPGTGKTEIARIVGKIARERKILAVGKFIEVSAAQLTSPIPGGTAHVVTRVFNEARGSVLFVDEAYSLGSTAAGHEAVDAMVKLMEDMREELIVILAGYTKDMEAFMKTNDGFASRVRTTIKFPYYSASELMEIFELAAKGDGYSITSATQAKALEIFQELGSRTRDGNGRFARQLLEEAKLNQAVRLQRRHHEPHELSTDNLQLLIPEDLTFKDEWKETQASIGFIPNSDLAR